MSDKPKNPWLIGLGVVLVAAGIIALVSFWFHYHADRIDMTQGQGAAKKILKDNPFRAGEAPAPPAQPIKAAATDKCAKKQESQDSATKEAAGSDETSRSMDDCAKSDPKDPQRGGR